MIHLDTSFVVDLLREQLRERPGPASSFLDAHLDEPLRISVHAVCELYAGAELSGNPLRERSRVRELCSSLEIIYPDDRFAVRYGSLLAKQERRGRRVPTMDLLIATAASLDGAPVVTANPKHFRAIEGLEVLEYS